MKIFSVVAALACAAALLQAVETKTWQQAEMADFERGNLSRLSLSSDGRLMLAPAVKEIFDPSVTFLWAVARDSKGNLFAGGGGLGGSKAKLVEVDASGKSKKLAEFDALAVQAIAIDAQDRVYAATSPDGKVYRVDASGNAQVFFDPKAKYIWAMAFAKSGDLYIATGDQGDIYRVTPSGAGSVFFKTQETHARSLALDANDNLIVGTDPSGLILRITPAGKSFVLYQAPKREITAVAVAPNGAIYAAGVGIKTPSTAPAPPAPAPSPTPAVAGPGTLTVNIGRASVPPPSVGSSPASITGGSDVYRIESDGFARRVWTQGQDVVYAIAFDSRGRAWLGTGNRGAVFRIDSDESYTRLLNVAPTQVTAFCAGSGGRIYAVTGNIGKILSIGPEFEATGTLESDVFDAGAFTYWGRLSHSTGENKNGSIVFETRSGNVNRPQENWSDWAKLSAGRIASPAARFVQYRATLSGAAELDEVDVAYQMKNIAPVVDAIEITPANYKFPAPTPPSAATPAPLSLPAIGHGRSLSSNPPPAPDSGSSPTLTYAKGQIGARWLANDENGDALSFGVEIRGINETTWQLLKDKLREHYYSWDSTAFPDGKYVLRVIASDAPSNPPAQALTGSLESDPFLIDNTPPEITALQGAAQGNKVEVNFHAKDGLSAVAKAEYSVNGGDWVMLDPVTRLTDSKEEDYRFNVDRAAGENTIAVRVTDEYDNQTVAKTVVK
jgi:hypothetical protein